MRALVIYYPVPLQLYQEFLAVCNHGDLVKIRQFHKGRIQTHIDFFPNLVDPKSPYSRFMGSVYCNLNEKESPVARWFQAKAAEIHQLY